MAGSSISRLSSSNDDYDDDEADDDDDVFEAEANGQDLGPLVRTIINIFY